ncbi:hypothetical protein Tco_0686269 [Tanacetum coccineum]
MEAAVQQYQVDKQCFDIQKKQFLIENERLLDQIISQDIVNIVVNSSMDVNTSVKVNSSVVINDSMNYVEMCNKCLELKAELIKQHNMVEKDEYNRLSKRFSKLEQHCISLEITMQLNKENFQKNNQQVVLFLRWKKIPASLLDSTEGRDHSVAKCNGRKEQATVRIHAVNTAFAILELFVSTAALLLAEYILSAAFMLSLLGTMYKAVRVTRTSPGVPSNLDNGDAALI